MNDWTLARVAIQLLAEETVGRHVRAAQAAEDDQARRSLSALKGGRRGRS